MPKIRIEVDVPDGEFCTRCKMAYKIDDIDSWLDNFVCFQFRDSFGYPLKLDLSCHRLPQCIAAEAKDDELIATAGAAATALAKAGYDAVEVFRALPEIIERWIDAEGVANLVMHQSPRSGDLLRRIKGE